MALSPDIIKLRQQREEMRKPPTPEQKAEEEAYLRENADLFRKPPEK